MVVIQDESMSASDVIARAAAKGLCALPGVKSSAHGDEHKPKKTSKTSLKSLSKSGSAKKERKGAKSPKNGGQISDHDHGTLVKGPSLLVKKPSSKRLRPVRTASTYERNSILSFSVIYNFVYNTY